MLYYRAKRDAYDYFTKNGVVLNELLTKREREKRVPYIQDCVFEPVHISQRNTCINFGVRYEYRDGCFYEPSCGIKYGVK